jgi:hypothetical protein
MEVNKSKRIFFLAYTVNCISEDALEKIEQTLESLGGVLIRVPFSERSPLAPTVQEN